MIRSMVNSLVSSHCGPSPLSVLVSFDVSSGFYAVCLLCYALEWAEVYLSVIVGRVSTRSSGDSSYYGSFEADSVGCASFMADLYTCCRHSVSYDGDKVLAI